MKSSASILHLGLVALVGCLHPAGVGPAPHPVSMSKEEAEAGRATVVSHEPASFKMLHQVVATYGGKNYLMTGYVLGRKDGAFRVSAAAAMGPKLFDVAKVGGTWQAHVYLKQIGEQFDPANLGRAVERIYFLPASGPLRAEEGSWVSRARLPDEEDVDTVEDWRDDGTLALRRKRYFKDGRQVLQVDFDKLEFVQGVWLARSARLSDSRGFSLELRVTGYEPGFPVPDEALKLQSP
jgi:hypothetical protein